MFKYPQDESINYLKRLIGLPGDHILVEDGFITINGEKVPGSGSVDELSYFEIWKNEMVQINRNSRNRIDGVQEFVVPEEMYFFMGDNRDNSSDSRSWGFVPRKNLKGRAHFVLWNISFANLVPQIEIDRIGKLLQ